MSQNFFIFRNYTVEPLFDHLEGCSFSGYNEIGFSAGFKYYVWFYFMPSGANRTALSAEIDFFKQRLIHVAGHIPNTASLLCITIWNTTPIGFTTADPIGEAIKSYNDSIFELAAGNRQIKVLDFSTFASEYGLKELIDKRHFYLSQVPVSPRLARNFNQWFLQKISAIEGVRKKCLVLDLDNTLWGGILGEDGISGIQLGNTYPGNCYRDFQSWIKEIQNTGVILALCSKNNPEDVQQAFSQRDEMVLKSADFSALRINWKNKPDNIIELAHELNIGIDSLVFIDDSPFEREQVKSMLPEVVVPDFPKQPYLLVDFIQEVYNQWFQVYELTEEDKSKSVQYQQNAQRRQLLNAFDTEVQFLKEMDIKLTISENNPVHIPRIAQMTQKTNQFNLTTKRYTEAEINNLISKGYLVWDVAVSDKFGDNGITALAIVKTEGLTAEIDNYMLSCRILGRGIENAFLSTVLNKLFEKGIREVKASFIPTAKNGQVENFYKRNGFELIDVQNTNRKDHHLALTKKLNMSDLYTIIQQ
ncbi:MAG: HAD-IIIC family phosphatase [Bacteroidales bacterium]|nr:HAD-IIIC family phosphatase [Bacteroidales bacterium]